MIRRLRERDHVDTPKDIARRLAYREALEALYALERPDPATPEAAEAELKFQEAFVIDYMRGKGF